MLYMTFSLTDPFMPGAGWLDRAFMERNSHGIWRRETNRKVSVWGVIEPRFQSMPTDFGPWPANPQQPCLEAKANKLVEIMKPSAGTSASHLDENIGVGKLARYDLHSVTDTKVTVQIQNHDAKAGACFFLRYLKWQEWDCPCHTRTRPNEQVSHRSQPPLTYDLPLGQPAGSGWLHRLVGHPGFSTCD